MEFLSAFATLTSSISIQAQHAGGLREYNSRRWGNMQAEACYDMRGYYYNYTYSEPGYTILLWRDFTRCRGPATYRIPPSGYNRFNPFAVSNAAITRYG